MRRIIALFTILVVAATLIIPVPDSWHDTAQAFHTYLAVAGAMAGVYFGAAWLFLSSLSAYKTNLRIAYTTLSVGIALNAIGAIQLAIISAFDLLGTFWVQSGGIVLPFMLSGLALYFGMRAFARLVGAKTRLTKVGMVLPCVALFSVLSIFLPHAPMDSPEIVEDVSNGILAWVGLLDLAAAGIAWRVRQHIGSHYTNAIAWMFMALIGSFIVVVLALIVALAVSGPSGTPDLIINILSVAVGVLYAQAGYAFHKAKDY